MNATEEIAVYKESPTLYQSPTLSRRTLGYSYDFPEKSPKKDKKWSISSIFRRKKKEESESSSEEDSQKKGFLNRRRKKSDSKRKRHVKTVGTFDHVVIPPAPRNSMVYNGCNYQEENGVLSDPTGGFSNYIGRPLPQPPNEICQKYSRESLNELSNSKLGIISGSFDANGRKSRKELTKARAEARRTSSRNASSSDEESQRSNSSLQIRSDDNLRARDNSANRKTRQARTERYLKRHSRDGENPHNYLRLSKSDAENSVMNWKLSDDSNRSPSRSPLIPSPVVSANNTKNKAYVNVPPQNNSFCGLSTIPPSHNSYNRFRVSNSTSNPSYKPPQSMNDYNNSTKKLEVGKYFPDQRSISCDANIHKAPSSEFTDEILHVHFPIVRPNRGFRNLSLIDPSQISKARQPPPPPPPRDPTRMVGTHYFEGGRPNTYYFDSSGQSKSKSFSNATPNPTLQQTKKFSSFNLNPNFRSTSEDHLPRDTLDVQLAARPSSTTPDSSRPHRYLRRQDIRTNPEDFNYLTDKNPRSRKPIFIQPGNRNHETHNLAKNDNTGSQKALDFWKQIDRQNANIPTNPDKHNLKKSRTNSPQMFTSHTRVQTKVFLPSVVPNDINNGSPVLNNNRSSSPFKPITPASREVAKVPESAPKTDLDNIGKSDKNDTKRKSSNLEEALDELEAIYNSLRLGDDDLLERAEQREKESQAKRHLLAYIDNHPNYSARGALSDSSFSYEPFDSVDSPRRKRMMRKNRTVDLKHDDMAFRKLNKERANTINDPQSVISKISYLQTSPVYGKSLDNEDIHDPNEPDITHDDVVYRNVKHANNALRIIDPQPPFGIPIGPVTPAANSDYLHAKPENIIYKPTFKHKKIPDIVKDDLAFRNLRKDGNKGPALPPLSAEDYKNNNSDSLSYLKKKRAQRSLSANIGSLINPEVIEKAKNKHRHNNNDVENEFKTLTDIADAMEIARRVLKEKENKISATKKAFMSDTDTQYIQPVSNNTSIREDRLSFLNGLRAPSVESGRGSKPSSPRLGDNILKGKPPRGHTPERRRSPKESTPIPLSPLEDKRFANSESTSSSLDDLLNALAEEAKETTERISKELKVLAENKEKRNGMKKEEKKEEKEDEMNKTLSEIDAVSEHAKLCEKLLECVVDSTALMSSSKAAEEVVEHISESPVVPESANVVVDRSSPKEEKVEKEESDHDYENLHSDKELNVDEVDVATALEEDRQRHPEKCRSPFEEHKEELIASFQELKGNIDDIEMPLKREKSEVKEIVSSSSKLDSIYDNVDVVNEESRDFSSDAKKAVTGEEKRVGVFDLALPNNECAFTINANPVDAVQTYTSNCDITLRKPNNLISHEDSETSSGFHSNCSCGESSHYVKSDSTAFDEFGSNNNLDSLESLKSPKLVLATSHKVPSSCTDRDGKSSSNFPKSTRLVLELSRSTSDLSKTNVDNSSSSRMPGNSLRTRSDDSLSDDEKPSPSWYRDPANLAFACSYGIACAHQLASIDLFAILGILFAVISFIAALFL